MTPKKAKYMKMYAKTASAIRVRRETKKRIHARKNLLIRTFKMSGCSGCPVVAPLDDLITHHVVPVEHPRLRNMGWGRMIRHLDLCVVLCKPCHILIHEPQEGRM